MGTSVLVYGARITKVMLLDFVLLEVILIVIMDIHLINTNVAMSMKFQSIQTVVKFNMVILGSFI